MSSSATSGQSASNAPKKRRFSADSVKKWASSKNWAGNANGPSNLNVPNALTALRLVLVPVFAWLLLAFPADPAMRWWATVVFLLAIATDAVDGRIARKYNLVTNFGKLWDPIADKALTGMAFIGLSILAELPWWITIVILVRELGITALRWAIIKYGVMAANRGGKLKTVTQSVALAMFLPGLQFMPGWWAVIAWIVMIAAFVLTVLTGLDYLREAQNLRRNYLAAHPEEDL
ncbi:CDP-diacylglycerol--glycerol-3-phosphate 3-phosphatidyltransferase [Nigerium sp.]|uniref:CDP-diacylglycerol--glycerol-3-phosphate 3-phosphatidyltransferase n=1 Tax=Nigerium sp. TaxID=2042655 RepID=UPI0032219F21